jgi:hypothetical protein
MKRIIPIILFTIFALLAFPEFTKESPIKDVLKKVNITPMKIYTTFDVSKDIKIAFYQDKSNGHKTVGIFSKDNKGIHFITQGDIQSDINYPSPSLLH